MAHNQKKIAALAVLLAIWGGLASWQWLAMEEPVRVPLVNVSGKTSAVQNPGGQAESQHVQLEWLSSSRTQREMSFTAPRNIFALPMSVEISQAVDAVAVEGSQEQQSILADLAQFHYLGFVRTGEDRKNKQDVAVLTKNDDLHVVRKGETIDHHVLVKAITQDSVTLEDRDSRVEHTVLLSEEAPAQP
ncbi:MAG TPA: hypothetical protein VJ746_19255 [Nitrospira sp.]|nr:hypothetical protein [Nitrospira sp.]